MSALAGHDCNRCLEFVRVEWPSALHLSNRARCDLVDGHGGAHRCRMGPKGREVLIVFTSKDVGQDYTERVLSLCKSEPAPRKGRKHVA